jgi:hypothetical protein
LALLAVGMGRHRPLLPNEAVAVAINLCFQLASFVSSLLEKIEELRKNLRELRKNFKGVKAHGVTSCC